MEYLSQQEVSDEKSSVFNGGGRIVIPGRSGILILVRTGVYRIFRLRWLLYIHLVDNQAQTVNKVCLCQTKKEEGRIFY